jgi:23S rRNA (adenine2030-N6)-methyltransferase
MNYRHCYHAGNFADVIKHAILVVLLQSLRRKDTPFCFLDTHAGIGLYELQSEQAQKKQEYENGIAKLVTLDKNNLSQSLQDYLSIVQKYNAGQQLHFYPGSPLIAESLLRPQDQMILCELHKEDNLTLKENFSGVNNISAHYMDGYLGMKAFLPPKQKRGLVLIDPPFEITNEFDCIFRALERALKHWRSGHFMVWYPIKNHAALEAFYDDIALLNVENLKIHFSLNETVEAGKLSSCGILLINPPWQVKEMLETAVLPILAAAVQARWKFVY